MSLSVTVTPSVALPDLATVEAAAKQDQDRLPALIAETKKLFSDKLAGMNATEADVRKLIETHPKLADQQLRGFLSTIARYERELEVSSGLIEAYNRVKAKVDGGQAASMFEVVPREWGRTRLRQIVKIVDKDLLRLHQAGLV